jgi:hypothetical protein
MPFITKEAIIEQVTPKNTHNSEDEFRQISISLFPSMPTTGFEVEDDFFSLIANRPVTHRTDTNLN